VHFDVVLVSGANEYKVNPRELVTTVTPPICAVFSAALDPAEPAAGVEPPDDVPLPPDDELPQAAAPSATAAIPAAASILRIDLSFARKHVRWQLLLSWMQAAGSHRYWPPAGTGGRRVSAWLAGEQVQGRSTHG
jgi:hypothetical protein